MQTEKELIALVKESHKDYIKPGRKPAGRYIFFREGSLTKPRKDIITLWRLLYVSCNTEYEFAIKAIGDWDIYQRLLNCCAPLRNTFISEWNKERELRLMSESYSQVQGAIRDGDVKSAQWLLTHLTKFKGKPTLEVKKETVDKVNTAYESVLDIVESNYDQLN